MHHRQLQARKEVKADIDLYMSRELSKILALDDLRDKALAKWSGAEAGMFLHIQSPIGALSVAIYPHGVSRALETLSRGINGVYTSNLNRSSLETADRRLLTCDVFSEVCCRKRLLSWTELEYALSWGVNIGKFSADHTRYKAIALEICVPLVEYDEGRDVFPGSLAAYHSVTGFLCSAGWKAEMFLNEARFLVDKARANEPMSIRLIVPSCIQP